MCTLSVSNVIYHKFSHGAAFYMLNGKNVNVMLELAIKRRFANIFFNFINYVLHKLSAIATMHSLHSLFQSGIKAGFSRSIR